MESSPSSSKKAKALGNIAQVAHCLVDGCSADLSLCRDYHRRHKVCEAHSKTPKVTIRGREQRFCQQCSRFHSLVEFDEGKRSCRKRLDGHNRRRRKPQPECHPRGSGQGTGTTRLVSFSSSPQILGSSVVGYSWSGVVKPEHEMGEVCNNQQVQLNYMETGSRYKGVSEVGIQQGSMFVDPSQRMFDSDGALSLLSSGTPAPREFGLRHDHYHHDHVPQTKQVIDYNGVGVGVGVGAGAGAGAGAGQYEESKGEEASPASSVSTFHFPEMFQLGMGSSTHQTLSFMWE